MDSAYTQLGLRKFPRRIARDVKKAAAERDMTLTEFMVLAATNAVRGEAALPSVDARLEQDVAWYERNRQRLIARYVVGTSLAIIDEEVVDHDADPLQLAIRVRKKLGRRAFFMPQLGGNATPVRHIRSPRRVR